MKKHSTLQDPDFVQLLLKEASIFTVCSFIYIVYNCLISKNVKYLQVHLKCALLRCLIWTCLISVTISYIDFYCYIELSSIMFSIT